jgi:hypothetical protein
MTKLFLEPLLTPDQAQHFAQFAELGKDASAAADLFVFAVSACRATCDSRNSGLFAQLSGGQTVVSEQRLRPLRLKPQRFRSLEYNFLQTEETPYLRDRRVPQVLISATTHDLGSYRGAD